MITFVKEFDIQWHKEALIDEKDNNNDRLEAETFGTHIVKRKP